MYKENDSGRQLPNISTIYERSPCGLISFLSNGKIIKANQTLLKWIDKPERAITELNFTDLLDKGGQLYYQLFIQPTLTLQQPANEINISLKTPVGPISCLLNASLVIDEHTGEKIVHAAIFRISDRKKYETELLIKKEQAEKEKELKTTVLKEVAYDQSHLVRLPLANILGLISLIDKPALNEETRNLFDLIEQSALKLDKEIKTIVEKTNV